MTWWQLALAGAVGWFARDATADEEIEELERAGYDRDQWVERAGDARWRIEELTGEEYEWPDERLDDE
jgi:hypothetical protein